MTLDQIVLWVVVGGVAGLLAGLLVPGVRLGLIGTIIIGILGAFVGGWLFGVLKIHLGSGILSDIFTAFIGAVVLLVVVRLLRRL
jgi:uncharacterized membrane protein YeaQ/YmgE (transglycosylase-associated protein family)